MPFDPRPVSQGGNRGIDERFSRSAPKGKYRVIGVDTFDGGDWHQGDFDTREAALECARSKDAEGGMGIEKRAKPDPHNAEDLLGTPCGCEFWLEAHGAPV